jgi:hypothetical protein
VKPSSDFDPGFRFSEVDAGFMILVSVLSPVLGRQFEQLTIAALFAVFHFFLFCNVLRAQRLLELLWAGAFVGLWSSSYFWGMPSWYATYALAFAVTAAVTVVQVLLPSYHGAFWAVLNPRLPQWWEQHTGRKI